MGLAGELSTIGLAEVFQNLAFNHLTGTLTLKEGDRKAYICFEGGRITAAAIHGEKLDYIEIARLAEAAPEEMLEKAGSGKRRRSLKAFLATCGGFEEARFDAGVASRVEDEILPLFGWMNGSFGFEEGKIKESLFEREQFGCDIDLDPQGVAMEAARRHDEWNTLSGYVPSEKDVLVPADGEFESPLEPKPEQLLALIDGTRMLSEIIGEVRMKKYDVLTGVARLVEARRVLLGTPADLRELASRAIMAGDVNLAARRLEVALQLDNADLETRRELIRLYERASRKTDAAREFMRLADVQAERGDIEGLRESLERASVLAPDDLDIMERIFRFHETRGEKVSTLRAGQRLASALVASALYEDAIPLFERLLMANEQSLGLRESFANCLAHAGEHDKAAQQLLLGAEHSFERGDYVTARRAYRSVLTIDPECGGAQARIAEIDSGAAMRREKRRKLRRRLAAALVICGLLSWQMLREWKAQGALHAVALSAVEALGRSNGDDIRVGTIAGYAGICSEHTFTRGAARAGDTLRSLIQQEIEFIEQALQLVPEARTTTDIDFSLGRAERQIHRIAEIKLPGDVQEFWDEEQARLMRLIKRLRSS